MERPGDLDLRRARPADDQAIREVTYAAFQNHPHHAPGAAPSEHLIAPRLREAGALTLSLVAERDGRIVGHLAVSPVEISGEERNVSSVRWFGLGPVAVSPRWQQRGIGSAMVRYAIAFLHQEEAGGLVVLGEPRFYRRFGFRAEAQLSLPGIPPAYFMALPMDAPLPTGTVKYHPAFG